MTGLAPLSKCQRLKHLDLSQDYYDISFSQVLRATRDLLHLSYLSLPQGANFGEAYPSVIVAKSHSWPPTLSHLQLNGIAPSTVGTWDRLIADLPETLRSLTFSFIRSWAFRVLMMLPLVESSAQQIRSLHIAHTHYTREPGLSLFKPFPNLKTFSVPYGGSGLIESFFGEGPLVLPPIENLCLTHKYITWEEFDVHRPGIEDLARLAVRFPTLQRMEVPAVFFSKTLDTPLTFIYDGRRQPIQVESPSEFQATVKSKLMICGKPGVSGESPQTENIPDVPPAFPDSPVAAWILRV